MKHLNIKIIGILLCLLLADFGLYAQELKKLTILHTNDMHSRVEPLEQTDTYNPGKAGLVRRVTYVKQLRQTNKDILLFDCGDFSQGTPYYNLFRGEVEIKMMNEAGYDAAIIGNHEFDYGLENMKRLFQMAQFPIVCSNYDFTGTVLEGKVKPYIILERNGLKVGVFGLSPKMDGLVQAAKCEGVVYKDPFAVANEMADFLKNGQKCDLVICLSHLGFAGSPQTTCDINLVQQTRNIDIVLGGHSHTFLKTPAYKTNLDGLQVPIYQMGKNGVFIGRMDVTMEKK